VRGPRRHVGAMRPEGKAQKVGGYHRTSEVQEQINIKLQEGEHDAHRPHPRQQVYQTED